MPRGKYVNHKGRSRHFTSPEELQQQSEEISNGSSSNESCTEDFGAAGGSEPNTSSRRTHKHAKPSRGSRNKPLNNVESSDEEDDSKDEDEPAHGAKKGVEALIQIENPNRITRKMTQKLSNLTLDDVAGGATTGKSELTRRESEQIEEQKARLRYEKLHAAGKTREAKADLARLALIRQQRAEAAAKREAEKKAAEARKQPNVKS